jgi:hypothetical protein
MNHFANMEADDLKLTRDEWETLERLQSVLKVSLSFN